MSVDIKVEQNFWLQNQVLLATNKNIVFYVLLGLLADSGDTFYVLPVTDLYAKEKPLNQILTIPEQFVSKFPDTNYHRLAGYDTTNDTVVLVFDLERTVIESSLIPLLKANAGTVDCSGFDEEALLKCTPDLSSVVKNILPRVKLPALSTTGAFYYPARFDCVGQIKWKGNGFEVLDSYLTVHRLGTCYTHELMGLYFMRGIDDLLADKKVTLHMQNLFIPPELANLSKLTASEMLDQFKNKDIEINIDGHAIAFTIL